MIFLSRRPAGPDRFLVPKIALMSIGAVVLLFGMTRNNRTAVLVAIVILLPALLLRFLDRGREKPPPIHEDWYARDDDERENDEGAAR